MKLYRAAPSPRPSPKGRGSQRAVGEVPIKCPCEGLRRWFFREVFVRMGTLNLREGIRRPAGPRAPGRTKKVFVNRQQRFQLPFDGSLSPCGMVRVRG